MSFAALARTTVWCVTLSYAHEVMTPYPAAGDNGRSPGVAVCPTAVQR
ncbi:hypothetical protein [Acerihabitans sp.]